MTSTRTAAIRLAPALGLLTACAVAPPPSSPPELGFVPPERWRAAEPPREAPRARWWESLGGPRLTEVVGEALAHNHDLRAAAARIEQAAALAVVAGAGRWPALTASFDASRQKQNFVGFPIPGSTSRVLSTRFNRFGVTLATSWELDLWGRLSAAQSAALADLEAAAATYDAARESLAAQTARAWFATVEARLQVELARRTASSYETTLETVRERFSRGVRPAVDVRLAQANVENARALLAARENALDAARRQLETLLGRYPEARLETVAELPDVPGPVPAGLPAELLRRRPDVIAAERRLAANARRVDEARAALFPAISLTASTGTASNQLGDLVDPDFSLWSLAAGIVQPILQGGRLRAQVELARARAREAAAAYAAAALRAYREVETALAAEAFLAERTQRLRAAADHASAARELAEDRYGRGVADLLLVLEAQRRELAVRSELLSARRQRLDARIDLHLALGGAFAASASQPPAASNPDPSHP